MKKRFLCGALTMALAASMLFGCAGSDEETTAAASAAETTEASEDSKAADGTEAAEEAAEATGEKVKVTLMVTGSFGDKAFNDSAQAGMERLQNEMSDLVEVEMIEMGNDKTKFEGSFLTLLRQIQTSSSSEPGI